MLIFNRRAGSSRGLSPEDVVEALAEAGFRAEYRETADRKDLGAALEHLPGPVFVAGGDGTLRAAALHLLGRPGVTVGLLPMGTSNNVAATLGVPARPLEVARGFRNARPHPFDVGRVTAPWGEDHFLEACGCGAFADLLAAYRPDQPKSPLRAVRALVSTLGEFTPRPLAATLLDVPAHPLKRTAMLEVMNTRGVGNGLRFATHADPGDGLLDVVQVDGDRLDPVPGYLAALARNSFADLPSVHTARAKRVEVTYTGQTFHVDDEIRHPLPGASGQVRIEVRPEALSMLVPTL